MRLLVLLLIVLATAASAETIPSEENIMPIMARFTMRGIISTCKIVDSSIASEYDNEFASWQARHAETLKEQEKYAASHFESDGKSLLEHAEAESNAIVVDFLKMDAEKQVTGCRHILISMERD